MKVFIIPSSVELVFSVILCQMLLKIDSWIVKFANELLDSYTPFCYGEFLYGFFMNRMNGCCLVVFEFRSLRLGMYLDFQSGFLIVHFSFVSSTSGISSTLFNVDRPSSKVVVFAFVNAFTSLDGFWIFTLDKASAT